ncbi:hypothetical protein J2793_005095 [Paraburkholderia caledonica]|uniref:JmjC domain-containing protein n=2 Tax=Paraburkholderia caledonica TaxID=134536 RepID=A0AB73IHX3_9BURK|nr:hypothetical protein [Paraburkholderia caledonica]
MSLAQYLKLTERDSGGVPLYVGDHPLPAASLCTWPEYFERWNTPRVWLGPAGTVTPLHCDFEDNLFAQVLGRKRFLLYSPAVADALHPDDVNPLLSVSRFDPERPNYVRFPLAESAKAIVCDLAPGDLLYLPAGWFHHVRALEFSLSVNRWTPDDPGVIATVGKGEINDRVGNSS